MRQEPPTIRRPLNPSIATIVQLAALTKLPPIKLERLVSDAPTLYGEFEKKKPNGKVRIIRPPLRPLRDLQRALLDLLQGCVRYPRWMMGGVPKRSIFNHALPHVGQMMVATFDVKAFYPSTSPNMVRPVLERFGLTGAALDAVLRLVTKDNQLPQGGPASGFLANLVLDAADRRIDALCRKHDLAFTRYVDDMAISGNTDLTKFHGSIVSAVSDCGYEIAPEKIRYMGRDVAQLVTKLRVNDKMRPTREFMAEVRADIRECLAEGAATVAAERGVHLHNLKNSLTGKVSHIRGADRAEGDRLRGMLCGVDWSQAEAAEPSESASKVLIVARANSGMRATSI